MTQCANCKCNQGRRDCEEPPEMPFAGFTDSLIDVGGQVCGWAMVGILIGWIVSIVMRWQA